MKILLAVLMCVVLGAAECFALKGGPPYPGRGANIAGSYAGVMVPNGGAANILGLFTLSIPRTGGTAGVVVMFVEGRTFVGTLSGIADPNKSRLSGVIEAARTSSVSLCNSEGDPVSESVTDRVSASLDASVRTTPRASFTISGTLLLGTVVGAATATTRDPSFCNLTAETTQDLDLFVDGFKQSSG